MCQMHKRKSCTMSFLIICEVLLTPSSHILFYNPFSCMPYPAQRFSSWIKLVIFMCLSSLEMTCAWHMQSFRMSSTPVLTDSTTPHPHLFLLLLFVLCVPQPKGDDFSPMQDMPKSNCSAYLDFWFFSPQVDLPVTWWLCCCTWDALLSFF